MDEITGKHYIAGSWVENGKTFQSDNPLTGKKNPALFCSATKEHVQQAAAAARDAFKAFANTSPQARAAFLRSIADEIEARGDMITQTAGMETGLPAPRLEMERGRTVNQLRFFASWIEEGSWLQARIDQADPQRAPMPKPDIRAVNKAIGPVAVFGASNFPLAFSTAGGDTASALAAGCPVIVKAHPAHPATCEIIARAIDAAIQSSGMPKGVFSQLQGNDYESGQELVAHPEIKAVGFTGSLAGGRALYDIASSRPEPIPFYGEMGSINPVFLLPEHMKTSATDTAGAWAQSLTMGTGQFCTNPGLVVMITGAEAEEFKKTATNALKEVAAQSMLTCGIANSYRDQTGKLSKDSKLSCLLESQGGANDFQVTPALFSVSASDWLQDHSLADEIFGPGAIIVECTDWDELITIAEKLEGQLTATLHTASGDEQNAAQLLSVLEDKAGRILFNGFPTGVEVCHAMVHGGPYPASTDARSTSVGTLAITRFVRPVSYQNITSALLPPALQDNNPLGLCRLVDGVWTDGALGDDLTAGKKKHA